MSQNNTHVPFGIGQSNRKRGRGIGDIRETEEIRGGKQKACDRRDEVRPDRKDREGFGTSFDIAHRTHLEPALDDIGGEDDTPERDAGHAAGEHGAENANVLLGPARRLQRLSRQLYCSLLIDVTFDC